MNENESIEILLVEDNPDDAELTLHALRERKLANRIRVARDGIEALDVLFGNLASGTKACVPRLILLDLKMPKLSGLEVLERIRADPRTASLPVVVLSSSREDRDIEQAYRLGANSYIVKPVEFETFVKAVGEVGLYWMVLNQWPRD